MCQPIIAGGLWPAANGNMFQLTVGGRFCSHRNKKCVNDMQEAQEEFSLVVKICVFYR